MDCGNKMKEVRIHVFKSVIGNIAITWSTINGEDRIVGIRLMEKMSPSFHTIPQYIQKTTRLIKNSLNGIDVEFDLNILDFNNLTDFQKKVLLYQTTIKRGSVTTYGQIAENIGYPGASRAVGNTLAMNPYPIIIPCHRTIRANGDIGGFRYGKAMKKRLLEMEGICFDSRRRVILHRY